MNLIRTLRFTLQILLVAVFTLNAFAQESTIKKPLGNFEIRILKKEKHHLHIAALLCALHLEDNANESQIKAVWRNHFEPPIHPDDELLVGHIMKDMCPEVKFKKIYL